MISIFNKPLNQKILSGAEFGTQRIRKGERSFALLAEYFEFRVSVTGNINPLEIL